MKIEDDFLEQNVFDEMQSLMMNDGMPWYYSDIIDSDKLDRGNKFQFVHIFYWAEEPISSFGAAVKPILDKIKSISLWRIKANLLTKTPTIVENALHTDMSSPVGDPLPEEKLKQWTTSIFYVNTNNGYTHFEDGTKVESVANRFVSFPSNIKHGGSSCTDEKRRIVINFNYFK